MNGLKLIEDASLSGVHITSDGYLAAEVKCARTGIQEYTGLEMNLPMYDRIRVYRPEEEVFSKGSMATYAGKPATDDHPSVPVTADNWKELTVGNIGNEVMRDGDFVKVPLILMDGKVIKKVQSGKRQLSMGYLMDLSLESGTTPTGEPYDAIQRNLKMNHIAIVDKGRAGNAVRIGDSWSSDRKTNEETPTMNLKTIVVDGLTVETTDAGAIAIDKLKDQLSTANDAITSAQSAAVKARDEASAAHDVEIAGKDAELAAKDAEIKELNEQIVTGDALDALVADRAALTSKAESLVKDGDFKGKTDIQIMTATVDAVYGESYTKDKSVDYITALFDAAKVPDVKTDKVADALKDKKPVVANDNGYTDYVARISNAYKGAAA